MTIDELPALINYPVHEATCKVALFGEGIYYKSMEREEAVKLSRRCMWLARLRGATNGKYGRHFGIEYPS